jgi:hypothetical protein
VIRPTDPGRFVGRPLKVERVRFTKLVGLGVVSEAASFEDLPGKWQAAVVAAEQNRPQLRIISAD